MMKRRDLLLVAPAALLATALPMTASAQESGLSAEIYAAAAKLVAADAVGPAFVAAYLGGQRSEERLLSDLEASIATDSAVGPVEDALRRLIAADFANDRICYLDGWYLSITECRLAALVAPDAAPEPPVAADTVVDILAAAEPGEFITIKDWGPRNTTAGTPFLVQSDGHSAMWFRVENAPRLIRAFVNGIEAKATRGGEVITLAIRDDAVTAMIDAPGSYEVVFVDPIRQRRQTIASFEVTAALCAPEAWGPQTTAVGVPFNRQPDGSVALWMTVGCFPEDGEVWLGSTRLTATYVDGLLTAASSSDLSFLDRAATLPLELRDPATGQQFKVGDFVVQ